MVWWAVSKAIDMVDTGAGLVSFDGDADAEAD